uniref:Nurim n=1 Tax=Chelonoidis abingdonii TaxID=106734 RepID=A0A8C0GAR1_CHEAB
MAARLLLMVPALGSFLFTFGTGVELIRFASLRAVLPGGGRPGWGAALWDPRVLRPLAMDLGLVVLFVLQHSLMATALVKRWTTSCFGVLQRSFYVFCTALALQVYYHCLGMGDPLALKSVRAVRLYSHLRHPVYLEFLLVLWAVPCLALDRLLLAGLFTAYLSCGHSLDQQDYLYLRAQLDKKFLVFSPYDGQASSYDAPC